MAAKMRYLVSEESSDGGAEERLVINASNRSAARGRAGKWGVDVQTDQSSWFNTETLLVVPLFVLALLCFACLLILMLPFMVAQLLFESVYLRRDRRRLGDALKAAI